jgi:hypothetical protein
MYVLLYCGVCTDIRLLPPGENPIAVRIIIIIIIHVGFWGSQCFHYTNNELWYASCYAKLTNYSSKQCLEDNFLTFSQYSLQFTFHKHGFSQNISMHSVINSRVTALSSATIFSRNEVSGLNDQFKPKPNLGAPHMLLLARRLASTCTEISGSPQMQSKCPFWRHTTCFKRDRQCIT